MGFGGRLAPPLAAQGREGEGACVWPPYDAPCARPFAHGVSWAGVSIARHVVVYRREGSLLESRCANGSEQCPPLRLPFVATAFAWTLDGERIIVGGTGPLVVVLEASSLAAVHYVGSNGGCACPSDVAAAAAARAAAGSTPGTPGSRLRGPSSEQQQLLPALSLGPPAAALAADAAGRSPDSAGPSASLPPLSSPRPPGRAPAHLRDPRLPRPNASLAPFPHHVTSLAVSEHEQALFVGLQSGELRVFSGREAMLTARTLHEMTTELGF